MSSIAEQKARSVASYRLHLWSLPAGGPALRLSFDDGETRLLPLPEPLESNEYVALLLAQCLNHFYLKGGQQVTLSGDEKYAPLAKALRSALKDCFTKNKNEKQVPLQIDFRAEHLIWGGPKFSADSLWQSPRDKQADINGWTIGLSVGLKGVDCVLFQGGECRYELTHLWREPGCLGLSIKALSFYLHTLCETLLFLPGVQGDEEWRTVLAGHLQAPLSELEALVSHMRLSRIRPVVLSRVGLCFSQPFLEAWEHERGADSPIGASLLLGDETRSKYGKRELETLLLPALAKALSSPVSLLEPAVLPCVQELLKQKDKTFSISINLGEVLSIGALSGDFKSQTLSRAVGGLLVKLPMFEQPGPGEPKSLVDLSGHDWHFASSVDGFFQQLSLFFPATFMRTVCSQPSLHERFSVIKNILEEDCPGPWYSLVRRFVSDVGRQLGDAVAECLYILGCWGKGKPLDVQVTGSLVQSKGEVSALGVLLLQVANLHLSTVYTSVLPLLSLVVPPRCSAFTHSEGSSLGVAQVAARFAINRRHLSPGFTAHSTIEASLKVLDGSSPYTGYDICILTASSPEESRSQKLRAEAFLGGRIGPSGQAVIVLSVLEEWSGGAGNLLGTLHAWQLACEQGKAHFGLDLARIWQEKERKIVMIHNGGSGKRCSPLVQSENGSRGSIRLPGSFELKNGQEPCRLLTSVLAQVMALAPSNDGSDLDVFWSSQLFFGNRDLSRVQPSPFQFTKICRPLTQDQALSDHDLKDLGIFEADGQDGILDFHAQGSFDSQKSFSTWRKSVDQAALDIGSFRIKHGLFMAMAKVYEPRLLARSGKRDLDPQFTQPAIAALSGLRASGIQNIPQNVKLWLSLLNEPTRLRVESFGTHLEVCAVLVEAFGGQPVAQPLMGLFSIGYDAFWWRYRRVSELKSDSLALLGRSSEAISRRRLRSILHPIVQSQIGNQWVEGSELSFEQVRQGITVGGVFLKDCIVHHSHLLEDSHCEKSVLWQWTGKVYSQGSVCIDGATKSAHIENSLLYSMAKEGRIEASSEVVCGVHRYQSYELVRSPIDVDGKAVDAIQLPGNSLSFQDMRAAKPCLDPLNRHCEAVGEVRASLGLGYLGPEQGESQGWPMLRALLQLKAEQAASTSLPLELETPAQAKLAGRAAAKQFMALYGRYGQAVLPDNPLEASPEQVEAQGALDLLSAIAMHPDDAIARTAVGPFFGTIMEPINDSLLRLGRDVTGKVMCRVWQQCRSFEGMLAFDQALSRFSLKSESDLLKRLTKIRGGCFIEGPEAFDDVKKVVILPRVTLGAEVAIGSTLLRRITDTYPHAQIHYFGDPKLAALFGGLPRFNLEAFTFKRRGTLADRLLAWVELVDRIEELDPQRVFGPDSRADQLGSLPVLKDDSRYWFWENSLSSPEEARPMAHLLSSALTRALGPSSVPARPAIWLTSEPTTFAQDVWRRLQRPNWFRSSVKFDVGGAQGKSLGAEFEGQCLAGILGLGRQICLFDRGFSPDELVRSRALMDAVAEQGVAVIEVTDLADGIGLKGSDVLWPEDCHSILLAFHGSIAGWAALAASCAVALSYDSVHQHLAAAEHPGRLGACSVIVPFVGHKVPWFPKTWSPVGLGQVAVFVPEGSLSETVAHTLELHKRLMAESQGGSASGPVLRNKWSEQLMSCCPPGRVFNLLRHSLEKEGLYLVSEGVGEKQGLARVSASGALTLKVKEESAQGILSTYLQCFASAPWGQNPVLWAQERSCWWLEQHWKRPALRRDWPVLLSDISDYEASTDADGARLLDLMKQAEVLAAWRRPHLKDGKSLLAYYRVLCDRPQLGQRLAIEAASHQLLRMCHQGLIPEALLCDPTWGVWLPSQGKQSLYVPEFSLDTPAHFAKGAVCEDGAPSIARWLVKRLSHKKGKVAIIGVVGSAGSGKTTLCQALVEDLKEQGRSCLYLGADAFVWPGDGFRYTQQVGGRQTLLWGPGIYKDAELARTLRALRAGSGVLLPQDPHISRPAAKVSGVEMVFVDGVFLGQNPEVYGALDLLLGVGLNNEERLHRKSARDSAPHSVRHIDVAVDFVEKMFHETRDVVLPLMRDRCHAFWDRSLARLYWRG